MLLSLAEASHGVRPRARGRGAGRRRLPSRAGADGRGRRRPLAMLQRARRRPTALLAQDHEIAGILHALDGRFMRPAPGGDLLRTPAILPTGRNLHGFDPFRIPSAFAVQDGARQAERLLAAPSWPTATPCPRSIAMVLWGTDNLKTEGGPIAQALALMGARPRFDSYGRLAGAELIPLDELGRPRVDVVITLSGIFRDLLPLQIKLLAEAALPGRAAPTSRSSATSSASTRWPTRPSTAATSRPRRCASSATPTAPTARTSTAWSTTAAGTTRTNSPRPTRAARASPTGAPAGRCSKPQLLQSVLAGVELAYQNLDSVELGVTTVDNYFDTLGGISRAVQRAKRTRRHGRAGLHRRPDARGDGGTVRTLAEQVALETRTRMLNPKWYEGMLEARLRRRAPDRGARHQHDGLVGDHRPGRALGLPAAHARPSCSTRRCASAWPQLNPTASAKVANRLLEALERQYWKPDAHDARSAAPRRRRTRRPARRRITEGGSRMNITAVPRQRDPAGAVAR